MRVEGLEHLGDLEYVQGGGMASVYRGYVSQFGPIAVKVPRPECPLPRFERELKIMLAIGEHPRIVRVFDGRITSRHHTSYLIMEWIDFPTLDDVLDPIRHGHTVPLSWSCVGGIAYHLCVALQHAYASARVRAHRDIKPNNIFVDIRGGQLLDVKLTDFGIAAPIERSKMTRQLILGRVEYMAPERMTPGADATIDQRSDIYSTGALMYECLCGNPPFSGESDLAVLASALRDEITPLSLRRGDLDRATTGLVMKCLSRNPGGRPKDVSRLASDIQDIVDVSLGGSISRAGPLTPVIQASPSDAMDILDTPSSDFLLPADSGWTGEIGSSVWAGQSAVAPPQDTGAGTLATGVVLLVFGFLAAGLGGVLGGMSREIGTFGGLLIGTVVGGVCALIGLIFLLVGIRIRTQLPARSKPPVFVAKPVPVVSIMPAMAELRILNADPTNSVVRLYDYPMTCGRDRGVDLRLPEDDVSASRVHANILFENGTYILENRSQNGTLVNGAIADGLRRLATGDRLQMGMTTVEFRYVDSI